MNPASRPRSKHLIAEISYRDNLIVCACSWRGAIDDFRSHRKEHGELRSR